MIYHTKEKLTQRLKQIDKLLRDLMRERRKLLSQMIFRKLEVPPQDKEIGRELEMEKD